MNGQSPRHPRTTFEFKFRYDPIMKNWKPTYWGLWYNGFDVNLTWAGFSVRITFVKRNYW